LRKDPNRVAGLIAEHSRLGRLRLTGCIHAQPPQHGIESRRRDRHRARLLALGRRSAQHDHFPIEIDIREP
jgi:hypothetical protein